jgi:hypothetical protein
VISVRDCTLQLSQFKTLGTMVAAGMGVLWAMLANLGRQMLSRTMPYIKRAWRFTNNDRATSRTPCVLSSAGC